MVSSLLAFSVLSDIIMDAYINNTILPKNIAAALSSESAEGIVQNRCDYYVFTNLSKNKAFLTIPPNGSPGSDIYN